MELENLFCQPIGSKIRTKLIYNQIKMGYRIQIMNALVYLCLLVAICAKTFTFQSCNETQIFNVATLQCSECPTNTIPNPNQDIPTSCVCAEGLYGDLDNACTPYGSGVCAENNYIPVFARNGQSPLLSGLSCQTCSIESYKNENGTGCTPCPISMQYVAGQGCKCSDSSMISTSHGCFPSSYTSGLGNLGESSSKYSEKLKYLFPACYYFKDLLSCSHLVNLCTYSSTSMDTAQCKFFSVASDASPYLYYSSSNAYYMPAGTFSEQTNLNFKLVSFLATGNYVGEKKMRLTDLVTCGMPSYNSGDLKIGNNIDFSCTYNFNHLLEMAASHTYKEYVYELFIQGANEDYYQVAVYLDQAQRPTRRFFLHDTSTTEVKIAKEMSLSILMNTTGHLLEPELHIAYATLSVQNGQVTPDSDKTQQLTYKMTFKYDTSNFQTAFIAILIVVSILALIQGLGRTYIGYLNRESLSSFFFYFFKFWALWMFYFLFCISGYWFLFSKTTQNIFIFIPSPADTFYPAFYTLAGLMGFFRILTVLIDKKDKLNTEVFLINWEKGQFKNSWREIFIINSLAEFYTHRTISIFWMLLVVMFFLVGLSWENHAAEVTHTDLASIFYFNPVNRVLLYFLGSAIFIVVGIVFKILRRISVIKWPYPFEDFVDYCNVTNISFFFMKKRSAQAHYIHASIPDRTEVTYKQINQAIRRGLNKNRNIANEVSFQDMQRMYIVYVCKDLEDKFNNMLKKIEDEQHEMNKATENKHKSKKNAVNPRQEFIEKKLKPHLEIISRVGSMKNKTITQSLMGMPPVNLRDPESLSNRNQVIFDDRQQVVTNVFPNGNEFQQIHTVIILFLMFILMTASIPVAAFLTYFVDEVMISGWIANSCREKLEKMTKVKQGFML